MFVACPFTYISVDCTAQGPNPYLICWKLRSPRAPHSAHANTHLAEPSGLYNTLPHDRPSEIQFTLCHLSIIIAPDTRTKRQIHISLSSRGYPAVPRKRALFLVLAQQLMYISDTRSRPPHHCRRRARCQSPSPSGSTPSRRRTIVAHRSASAAPP